MDEDAEVPEVVQLGAEEEDAVDDQQTLRRQHGPAERGMVEGVLVVADRRLASLPVALLRRPEEVVGAESLSVRQPRGELVGERRLPGRVDAVDGDPSRQRQLGDPRR